MKKYIAVALVGLLILVLIAACVGNDDDGDIDIKVQKSTSKPTSTKIYKPTTGPKTYTSRSKTSSGTSRTKR